MTVSSPVKTHCLFDSSGALCLTRTHVLKAEPEEDIGDDREEVTNQENGEDTEDINDGQGESCARQSNEGQGQRYLVRVRVSQVDSLGTVLSISQGFIYIWAAHGPWSVRSINRTLFIINEPYYQQ